MKSEIWFLKSDFWIHGNSIQSLVILATFLQWPWQWISMGHFLFFQKPDSSSIATMCHCRNISNILPGRACREQVDGHLGGKYQGLEQPRELSTKRRGDIRKDFLKSRLSEVWEPSQSFFNSFFYCEYFAGSQTAKAKQPGELGSRGEWERRKEARRCDSLTHSPTHWGSDKGHHDDQQLTTSVEISPIHQLHWHQE